MSALSKREKRELRRIQKQQRRAQKRYNRPIEFVNGSATNEVLLFSKPITTTSIVDFYEYMCGGA
jgi:hypothetical protein